MNTCKGLSTFGCKLASSFVVIILMLPLAMTWGQEMPKPSAVIAIAPINEQLNDVEYLAAATSESIGQMSGLVRFQAQGFLNGVDFEKPAGAMLYFQEGQMEPDSIAFFPVSNMDDVLDKISEFAEVDEESEFIEIIPDNGEQMYMKNKGNYAFASTKSELLKNLPENPGTMVAQQAKDYNIAATIYPQRIPKELRQQALDWVKESYEATVEDLDDLQSEFQQMQFESNVEQMEMFVNEVETLTIGMQADKESERVFFDLNMKGKSGSKLAAKLAASSKFEPTQFAGFLVDQAAFTMHNCSGIDKEDAERISETLVSSRDLLIEDQSEEMDDAEIDALTKLSDKVIESIKKTLMAGTLDMGGFAFTNDGLNAVFGGKLVDARGLESTIKEIVADNKDKIDGEQLVFNLDSGSHAGFNLHQITVALDQDEYDEKLAKVIGEKLNIVLGIGQDKAYAAVGKNPIGSLKKAIDANASSGASRPDLMGQYNLFVAPIVNLISQIETEEPMIEDMRQKIEEAGKDRLRFTYNVVNEEMKMRSEIQDGIFQLLGVFAEAMQGGMGGGADF